MVWLAATNVLLCLPPALMEERGVELVEVVLRPGFLAQLLPPGARGSRGLHPRFAKIHLLRSSSTLPTE